MTPAPSNGAPRSLDRAASAPTLVAIRREAIEALLALPRVGMGIAGILTGQSDPEYRITARTPIPCSHAFGPAFVLTAEEILDARRMAAAARHSLIGMYLSKTRGELVPGDTERDLFDAVTPGSGRILILVRPSTVEPVRAVLFIRQPDESLFRHSEWEMEATAPVALEPEPLPAPAAAGAVAEPLAEPVPLPSVAAPAFATGASPFFREPDSNQANRRTWFAWAGAAILLAGAGIAGISRNHPSPTRALSLDVTGEDSGLVFHWNRDAVAGISEGRLVVNDAGAVSEFPLRGTSLSSGEFRYLKKSDRITATLQAGGQEARAVYFGPGADSR